MYLLDLLLECLLNRKILRKQLSRQFIFTVLLQIYLHRKELSWIFLQRISKIIFLRQLNFWKILLFEYLEKRKVWLVYLPLIIYWLILFIATSLPVERLPSIGFSDKINHFIAYFVLSILLNLTLIYQRKSRFLFEKATISNNYHLLILWCCR